MGGRTASPQGAPGPAQLSGERLTAQREMTRRSWREGGILTPCDFFCLMLLTLNPDLNADPLHVFPRGRRVHGVPSLVL